MLKVRQNFGKYVIQRKLGAGGFAAVYQARDTIEGIRVALKIPFSHLLTGEAMDTFRREARLAAMLEHPHVLPLKYAEFIEGRIIHKSVGWATQAERLVGRRSLVAF